MAEKTKQAIPTSEMLLLIFGLELVGAIITGLILNSDAAWYSTLAVPFFSAPSWFTAEVWIFLYLFMVAALYIAYENKGKKNMNVVCVLFVLATILPLLRAVFFWQLHYLVTSTSLSALEWLLVIGLTLNYRHISSKASLFMLPVILWTMYSLILGLSILALNGIILTI